MLPWLIRFHSARSQPQVAEEFSCRGSSDLCSVSTAALWPLTGTSPPCPLSGPETGPCWCGSEVEGQQKQYDTIPPLSPMRSAAFLPQVFLKGSSVVCAWQSAQITWWIFDWFGSFRWIFLPAYRPTVPPLPYVHQRDLHLFIIPVEAWLSVSMVCCSSDTPLCNWGNVTVIHQAICLFGEVNFYRPSFESFPHFHALPLLCLRCTTCLKKENHHTDVELLCF